VGTAIKHPVPDRVKPSLVIFDIRALWRSGLSIRVPGCQKYHKWRLNPVWHRMLYSCTYMATVGVEGLTRTQTSNLKTKDIILGWRRDLLWETVIDSSPQRRGSAVSRTVFTSPVVTEGEGLDQERQSMSVVSLDPRSSQMPGCQKLHMTA